MAEKRTDLEMHDICNITKKVFSIAEDKELDAATLYNWESLIPPIELPFDPETDIPMYRKERLPFGAVI